MILTYAKTLHRMEQGRLSSLLQGSHIALLAGPQETAYGRLFERSASALGAQVAYVRTDPWAACRPEEIQQLASVLGRLYVALACDDIPAGLVQAIADAVAIPVLAGVVGPGRLLQGLAGRLDIEAPDEDKRRLVMQAALLLELA